MFYAGGGRARKEDMSQLRLRGPAVLLAGFYHMAGLYKCMSPLALSCGAPQRPPAPRVTAAVVRPCAHGPHSPTFCAHCATPVQRSHGSLWWPRPWPCLWRMVSPLHACVVPGGAWGHPALCRTDVPAAVAACTQASERMTWPTASARASARAHLRVSGRARRAGRTTLQ